MGLLSSEKCVICGLPAGMMDRAKLKDGSFLCKSCSDKASRGDVLFKDRSMEFSVDDIKQRLEEYQIEQEKYGLMMAQKNEELRVEKEQNRERVAKFIPSQKIGNYIWFDDENKWFVVPTGIIKPVIYESFVFKYDEILNFELLEDGASLSKGGLGGALIGGAVFGAAGAIAGGTSKKTINTCNMLEIKVTTRNKNNPIVYIKFIIAETKKNSPVYKVAFTNAQAVLSKFQIIVDQLEAEKNSTPNNQDGVSAVDEIKKYKELLDMGAITEEEFTLKKKQLMGI